jgi:hypothetical protein
MGKVYPHASSAARHPNTAAAAARWKVLVFDDLATSARRPRGSPRRMTISLGFSRGST